MKTLSDIVAELRMGDDGGKPAYRIGRADTVEVSMPSGTPVSSYVVECVTIKELADWIEAAVERERRQYESLHDCFWDKFAVQCIIRQMRDDRDDLKRAYPETAEKLEYFADALVKARCGRAPGNAAAMRKALNEIDRVVWDKKRHTKEETEAHRLATEALSAPARNCDKMPDIDNLTMHDLANSPCKSTLDYASREELLALVRWLIAPAAERKGEGDGR